LYKRGWQQKDIAEAMAVTQGAISQWIKRADAGGVKALETPRTGGRPAQLSQGDRRRLVKLLEVISKMVKMGQTPQRSATYGFDG
jgi:transposase